MTATWRSFFFELDQRRRQPQALRRRWTRSMMGRAIKAEFRKFFTTRMWWGMAIPCSCSRLDWPPWSLPLEDPQGTRARHPADPGDRVPTAYYTSGLALVISSRSASGSWDRVGVPPQDDLGDVPAVPNGVRVMLAKGRHPRHRERLRPRFLSARPWASAARS
jgi:hypothetical protein